MYNIKSFHLEITRKCSLGCNRCPRNMYPDEYKSKDLGFDDIKKIFSNINLENIDYILLCGIYGDPIYHKNFLEIIKFLKNLNLPLRITTNGSLNRGAEWWAKLASLLTEQDKITFSVDGLEDTNHLYRKNANWQNIITALKAILKSTALVEWKFIVFKHNQHQLVLAKQFAESLGVKHLVFVKSNRFGKAGGLTDDNDALEPDEKYLSEQLKNRRKNNWKPYPSNEMILEPQCIKGSEHTINGEGYYSPCCYTAKHDKHYENPFWTSRSHFSLKQKNLNDIFRSQEFTDIAEKLKQYSTAPEMCKRFCGRHISQNKLIQSVEQFTI